MLLTLLRGGAVASPPVAWRFPVRRNVVIRGGAIPSLRYTWGVAVITVTPPVVVQVPPVQFEYVLDEDGTPILQESDDGSITDFIIMEGAEEVDAMQVLDENGFAILNESDTGSQTDFMLIEG